MTDNPFRNAITTLDLLTDYDYERRFFDALLSDWDDYLKNGNPIQHDAATTEEEAKAFVDEWAEGSTSEDDPGIVRGILYRWAQAYDLATPYLPQPISSGQEWGDEPISTGHYIDLDELASDVWDAINKFHVTFQDHDTYDIRIFYNVDPNTVEVTVDHVENIKREN